MELPDRYEPRDVERRIYDWWLERGDFGAEDVSNKPPFAMVLPPPNVTGQLHLGHALNQTIQDALARWKRMSGHNVLWMPGTDHAGIATQSVVERELKKTGRTRRELGRGAFVEKVWEWKREYGDKIVSQMKRLGGSCDWERQVFTLDEGVSRAVRKTFVELHKKGLIYRGLRLINWSPPLESAISDLEVEYKEVKGHLWHIRYDLADGSGGSLTVATTRPETLLGDVAVAVHPEDERYRALIGREVTLPVTGRRIPVIGDGAIDREFGSGVVKITPAHDFNDYAMGQRHGLPTLNILNKDGTLGENAPESYRGLRIPEARKQMLAELEASGHLAKTEPHVHQVGHCSRTGAVAEPFLSEQWFVKVAPLAGPARQVVETGTITFEPESWTKTYLHWMSIIGDWCISRQLWWGHRIPAWHCESCSHITVAEEAPETCSACGGRALKQEDDVLDTWFSSALWPFSTLGWPAETEAQKTFYPTSVLVTGFDIIFFWVARMIMLGLEFKRDVPFRKVYVHGLIRDAQGKKMSKSLGNAEDPVALIESYGADALRYTLMAQIAGGRDLKFALPRLEGYRNFMNKIWNAARFALRSLGDFEVPPGKTAALPEAALLSAPDQWILFKLGALEAEVEQAFGAYRFSDVANALYHFTWNVFCDWYLEFTKPIFAAGADARRKAATQLVLAHVLDRILKLLHPLAPFITEEIYQKLPLSSGALIRASYPTPRNDAALIALGSAPVAEALDLVREVILAIRNVRGENRIKPGVAIPVRLVPATDAGAEVLRANVASIVAMAKVEPCVIGEVGDLRKCAVQLVQSGPYRVDVVVPLEGLVDFAEEIARLEKGLEKARREVAGLDKRLSDAKFMENAPEEVRQNGVRQRADAQAQIVALKAGLQRLR